MNNNEDIGTRQNGLGGLVVFALSGALIAYLTFAALQGEHGLFRLFQVTAVENRLKTDLAQLSEVRAHIADKAFRLSTEGLDIELLDQQARTVLGLGREGEMLFR